MEYFNSRKKEYKSKISAIATDELIKFTIVAPRSINCSNAELVVTKENESSVYCKMFWAGMCGDDHEYWDIHFSASTEGLYWYHFELDTPWGKHYLRNVGHGIGEFAPDGEEFQQTVYKKDFKTPDWIKGGIIYQIFPDRFYNSGKVKQTDSSRVMRQWGDEPFWKEEQMNGIWNNDYFGGDLQGIIEKLPYISELGVSCIYLNPIFEAHSNHRYDTGDYEKIDSLLGDEKDFKELCTIAKNKYGISIILDGVFSHTGVDSKYFNKYSHYNSVGAYNSQNSPYINWYKFKKWPDDYESWWGIKLLPEVEEDNADYLNYICGRNGIIRKWLRCGASGWRLDVADELPDKFLDELRIAVKDENKDALIIGEVWEDATNKFAYGQRRKYLLGDELDSVMNYPFASAILEYVRHGNGYVFMNSIMSVIENYPPQVLNVLMNHIGTHDTVRAINKIAGIDCEGYGRHWQYEHNKLSLSEKQQGISLMKMASLIQFTLPGVPSIYYGDEIGLEGLKDPFNRTCMNWDDIDNELHKWYVRLGNIRNAYSTFSNGEFVPVYNDNTTICYKRTDEKNDILIAINNGSSSIDFKVGKEWDDAYILMGDSVAFNGLLHVSPYRYCLLVKN